MSVKSLTGAHRNRDVKSEKNAQDPKWYSEGKFHSRLPEPRTSLALNYLTCFLRSTWHHQLKQLTWCMLKPMSLLLSQVQNNTAVESSRNCGKRNWPRRVLWFAGSSA